MPGRDAAFACPAGHDRESRREPAGSRAVITWIEAVVKNGRVIVATDDPFAEKDGPHPYLIGEGEARAALDIAAICAFVPPPAEWTAARFAGSPAAPDCLRRDR
jgi:hypothetical protein